MADVIERLRNEKARVMEQLDALDRRAEEIDMAISEAEGDHLAAEWHRLKAQGRRDEAHAAWVRMMAASAVRMNRDPADWVKSDAPERIAELRAEVERLRSARPEAEARESGAHPGTASTGA